MDKVYRKIYHYPGGPFYLRSSRLTAESIKLLTKKYGSLIMFNMGLLNKCLLITDICLARKAFNNDEFCNHNHQLNPKYKSIFENLNGTTYDIRRNLMKRNLNLNKYALDKLLNHYLFRIWDSYSSEYNLQFFPTQDLEYLSFFIIFTTIFGFKYNKVPNLKKKEYIQFMDMTRRSFEALDKLLKMQTVIFPSWFGIDKFISFYLPPFNKYSKIIGNYRQHTTDIIDKWIKEFESNYKNANDKEEDLLIVKILKYMDENKKTLKRCDILCDLESLFQAGCFANTNTITNVLVLLAKYPDIQQKIYEEIIDDNINTNYHLLKAFIYESLRITGRIKIDKGLLGSNGVARCIMTNNVKLNGYNIPKHCKVFALCGMFNNDTTFFKNPNQFDIDHFLQETENGMEFTLNTGFCRFGIGKRNCLAQTYVIKVLYNLLPKLLLRYKFIIVDIQNNEKKSIQFDQQRLKAKLLSIPLMVERR